MKTYYYAIKNEFEGTIDIIQVSGLSPFDALLNHVCGEMSREEFFEDIGFVPTTVEEIYDIGVDCISYSAPFEIVLDNGVYVLKEVISETKTC